MRVLVTGGSGFIGTNLIEQLSTADNVEILNVDIAKPRNEKHNVFWRNVDIVDFELVPVSYQLAAEL